MIIMIIMIIIVIIIHYYTLLNYLRFSDASKVSDGSTAMSDVLQVACISL